MADTDKLVEQLSSLSVLEIAGLVKQLEEKWGVSAAAPVAVAAGPAAGAGRRFQRELCRQRHQFRRAFRQRGSERVLTWTFGNRPAASSIRPATGRRIALGRHPQDVLRRRSILVLLETPGRKVDPVQLQRRWQDLGRRLPIRGDHGRRSLERFHRNQLRENGWSAVD